MLDAQQQLGLDDQRRADEAVERGRHRAFGRVLHRHDAVIGVPVLDLVKDGGDRVDRNDRGGRPELRPHRLVGERPERTEAGDPQRFFQRQARRHDLAEDRADVVGPQRAAVARQQPLQDALLAVRRVDGVLRPPLVLADGDRQPGALVQQREQLLINPIDVGAQSINRGRARQGAPPKTPGRPVRQQ